MVARLRTGHLSTEGEERSGRPNQMAIPENVDAIHSMIMDDRGISAKRKLRPWRYPEKEYAVLFMTI
jgi:hypothetical protein